ncbi:MAG: hypothetical protein J2P25_25120, partial [Nocardiopsaceae bacterium]|nr:hypothetical protein [Nocardiopsaceae bacterium]
GAAVAGAAVAGARAIAAAIRDAPLPVVALSYALTDVTEFGRRVMSEAGFSYVTGGIEHGMTAVANVARWTASHAAALSGF